MVITAAKILTQYKYKYSRSCGLYCLLSVIVSRVGEMVTVDLMLKFERCWH